MHAFNPLIATLKPHSNGPSYSNTVIGTLAVDGWAFGTARRVCAGCGPAQAPHRCTKCNSPPINGQCTNFVLFNAALQLALESKWLNVNKNLACYSGSAPHLQHGIPLITTYACASIIMVHRLCRKYVRQTGQNRFSKVTGLTSWLMPAHWQLGCGVYSAAELNGDVVYDRVSFLPASWWP